MQNKYLRVTMPDSSKWDVPVMEIARNRALYYAEHDGMSLEESLNEDTLPLFRADPYKIKDWAANNMNWEDVQEIAVRVPGAEEPDDYQEGWVNGDKEIVTKEAS